jgi:hypothetical protein
MSRVVGGKASSPSADRKNPPGKSTKAKETAEIKESLVLDFGI